MQKGKWLSDEALQTAEKRRGAKGKGEKERYNHVNAEFQRISKRDKKAFLSDQCKEIAEKTKDTKGKGEKERYSHLNAEFQRIARRDKSLPQ